MRETGDLVVTSRVVVPADELGWRFSRSGGPGGQHVNTADTRVELSFDLSTSRAMPEELRTRAMQCLSGRLVNGVLTVVASDTRSQVRNRQAAATRMVALLRTAVAPPAKQRRPTKPSRGAVERRLTAKKVRGQRKADRRPPHGDW